MTSLEARTEGITPEDMKAAQERLTSFYGIYSAARRARTDENGSIAVGGQTTYVAPFSAISPIACATKVLETQVKETGNAMLAQFLKDTQGIFNTKGSLETFERLYKERFEERKLSEVVALAGSLGIDTTAYNNLEIRGYMDKAYKDIKKEIEEFGEKSVKADKEGKPISAAEKLKYLQLSTTMNMLTAAINSVYDRRLEAQALKTQMGRYQRLTDHARQDQIVEALEAGESSQAVQKRAENAIKAAGLEEE